jgi:hypothetical protein
LQSAVAPAGAPAGARTVGICVVDALPEVAAGVEAGAAGAGGGVDAAGAPASHWATPPWAEQAPRCVFAVEYDPSPQRAVAPAWTVECVVRLDVAGFEGWSVAGVERVVVDLVVGFFVVDEVRVALTRLATPPCAEHRPWVDLAVE